MKNIAIIKEELIVVMVYYKPMNYILNGLQLIDKLYQKLKSIDSKVVISFDLAITVIAKLKK